MTYPYTHRHRQTLRESHSVLSTTCNTKISGFFLRTALNRILLKLQRTPQTFSLEITNYDRMREPLFSNTLRMDQALRVTSASRVKCFTSVWSSGPLSVNDGIRKQSTVWVLSTKKHRRAETHFLQREGQTWQVIDLISACPWPDSRASLVWAAALPGGLGCMINCGLSQATRGPSQTSEISEHSIFLYSLHEEQTTEACIWKLETPIWQRQAVTKYCRFCHFEHRSLALCFTWQSWPPAAGRARRPAHGAFQRWTASSPGSLWLPASQWGPVPWHLLRAEDVTGQTPEKGYISFFSLHLKQRSQLNCAPVNNVKWR